MVSVLPTDRERMKRAVARLNSENSRLRTVKAIKGVVIALFVLAGVYLLIRTITSWL